jgi:hypothetical protein
MVGAGDEGPALPEGRGWRQILHAAVGGGHEACRWIPPGPTGGCAAAMQIWCARRACRSARKASALGIAWLAPDPPCDRVSTDGEPIPAGGVGRRILLALYSLGR